MTKGALFIPKFAEMEPGVDWDIAMPEQVAYENEISREPIEDPTRSFVRDHSRQLPIILGFQLLVSANPVDVQNGKGPARIASFYDRLLDLKASQTVGVNDFIEVYTGLRVYKNMAIRSIYQTRQDTDPNTAIFNIELEEFEGATQPKLTSLKYLLDAHDGPIGNGNSRVVSDSDRMITESTTRNSWRSLEGLEPDEERIITVGIL